MPLIVTRGQNEAERRQALRQAEQGKLRSLYAGIYTNDLNTPLEVVVRRELYPICALLAPGAIISHRSVLKSKVAQATYYLTGQYSRSIEIGSVQLKIYRGPGPLPTDIKIPTQFGSAYASSDARAFLEVLTRGRTTDGEKRTLDTKEVEDLLEQRLNAAGENEFNKLRDQAKECAEALGLKKAFVELDKIMGAILGTRDHKLKSDRAIARAAGEPVDGERLDLFNTLLEQLKATPVAVSEPSKNLDLNLQAFIESYFSNFIEGTEFEIDEAHEIVTKGAPLEYREDDSHDIIGTVDAVMTSYKKPQFPNSYEAFEEQLREWNRKVIYSRAAFRPGHFKIKPNRAGDTFFVMPDYVKGTLKKGYEIIMAAPPGGARAAMAMFVVAEIHPFSDGNGRTARLAMNLALTAEGLNRIIIPTVFRDDYLTALRALTRGSEASPFPRMLSKASEFSSWLDLSTYDNCLKDLEASKAMNKEGVLRFGSGIEPDGPQFG